MKTIAGFLILLLSMSANAKTYTIKNEEALRMVEAMVWTGTVFTEVDANIKKQSTVQPIACRYTKNADGILADVHCHHGLFGIGGNLPPEFSRESLAFFQAIRNYAKETNLMSFPAIQVDNVTCTMRVSPRRYTCVVTVN